jgi:RNA polymerase sigma-70 factor, ECF subfamily
VDIAFKGLASLDPDFLRRVRSSLLATQMGQMATATMSRMASPSPSAGTSLDDESRLWIDALRGAGAEHDEATARLHELLLGAARFEVNRRRASMPHLRGDDFDDLAHQAAGDALVAVLAKLDEFRGESRFTTWAYKFALLEAAAKLRRRAWQGRELPVDPERWSAMPDQSSPAEDVEHGELLGQIQEAIDSDLSPHQREVLLAVAVNDVPIDVMAERLQTTRGALYKTIHDARKKLRSSLADAGFELEGREEVRRR